MLPNDFSAWRRYIKIECRLTLTPAFVAARIGALSDVTDASTRRFVETWGEAHRAHMLGWFRQAQRGLKPG
jgi:hypothetical protein